MKNRGPIERVAMTLMDLAVWAIIVGGMFLIAGFVVLGAIKVWGSIL